MSQAARERPRLAREARERRRMAPEARRAQILEAAFRVFAERGYHASRMDDLVRESGLSKGSLYWHFESKEEVFLALFDALEADILTDWNRADRDRADWNRADRDRADWNRADRDRADRDGAEGDRTEAGRPAPALAALRRDAEVVLERMSGQRVMLGAWMEFLSHPVARERMRLAYQRSRSRAAELIARGIVAGEIRADLAIPAAAALLTGAIEGLVLQSFVTPEFDAMAAWRGAWPVLQRGFER